MNITSVLLERNKERATPVITESGGSVFSYQDIDHQIKSIASVLKVMGVNRGNCVHVLLLDRASSVSVFLALMYIGAVAVLINPRYKEKTITYMLQQVDCNLVIAESNLHNLISQSICAQIITIDNLLISAPELTNAVNCDKLDPACIIWSSGTTGMPKPIVHSQLSMLNSAQVNGSVFGYQAGSRVYATGKITWSLGISHMLYCFWNGSHLLLDTDLALIGKIKKNLDRFQPDFFVSVPTVYAQLANKYTFDQRPMTCICGGERVPQQLIDKWRRLTGYQLHIIYGLSECMCQAFFNKGGVAHDLGSLVPGWSVRIVDDNNQPVLDEVTGNIQIRSPTFALGFWKENKFAGKMIDGWFDTGDLGFVLSGKYYFQGRKNTDIVKISGQFVNLSNLEIVLLDYPDIEQVVVTVNPNQDGINQIQAYVIPNPTVTDPDELIRNLKRHMFQKLSKIECAQIINIVTSIPRTDTGKISRSLLAA